MAHSQALAARTPLSATLATSGHRPPAKPASAAASAASRAGGRPSSPYRAHVTPVGTFTTPRTPGWWAKKRIEVYQALAVALR